MRFLSYEAHCSANAGKMMRDIRDDLQNRANQLAEPAVAGTDQVAQGRPDARLPAWLEHSIARPAMRDIRDDLEDRTKILDEQIKSARDQFEALITQLKQEHEDRIEDLKAELTPLSYSWASSNDG